MKKFLEKHDLIKLALIFVVIAVILSWVCNYSLFNNGILVSNDMQRIGFFDFAQEAFLGFSYFAPLFIFVLFVAGFYQFLNSLEVYRNIVSTIAAKFNSATAKKIFVALVMFILAALSGVVSDYYILLLFIPFIIGILAKMNVDKITGLSATFGAVLVGIIGSTYSTAVAGSISAIAGSYGYELMSVIILFVIAYLLLLFFTFNRMNKIDKRVALLEDPFHIEEVKKRGRKKAEATPHILPAAIILALFAIFMVLAFIPWEAAFEITFFKDLAADITEAELFGKPVFYYLLGQRVTALGTWTLFSANGMIIIATLILSFIYHVSFDSILDSYAEGIKKIGKTVAVLFVVYMVVQLAFLFPTIPGLVNNIVNWGTTLKTSASFIGDIIAGAANIFSMFISALFMNLFSVEAQYSVSLIGSFFASLANPNAAALAIQSTFGIVGFIAPTSAMLMLGLSFLNVSFAEWFKHIWKYVLALVLVSLIIIAIVIYV